MITAPTIAGLDNRAESMARTRFEGIQIFEIRFGHRSHGTVYNDTEVVIDIKMASIAPSRKGRRQSVSDEEQR